MGPAVRAHFLHGSGPDAKKGSRAVASQSSIQQRLKCDFVPLLFSFFLSLFPFLFLSSLLILCLPLSPVLLSISLYSSLLLFFSGNSKCKHGRRGGDLEAVAWSTPTRISGRREDIWDLQNKLDGKRDSLRRTYTEPDGGEGQGMGLEQGNGEGPRYAGDSLRALRAGQQRSCRH